MTMPDFIIVMGVSGTGKSEIAQLLSQRLDVSYIEADTYHSRENVELMRQGVGLTDDQRWPWLNAVAGAALALPSRPAIVACSALKRSYRDFLRERLGSVVFIFLDGPDALIRERLGARKNHFAGASLLASQLTTLERPGADEWHIRLEFSATPQQIAEAASRALA